jgi:uncharacterized membrane protein YphA (DoxX/SURF4 family)
MSAYLTFLVRTLAAYVFLYAAISKASDLKPFSVTVRQLGVPERFAYPTAVLIACSEGLVGAWLAIGIWASMAGIVVLLIVLTFISASVLAIVGGLDTPCNCFGKSETRLGWATLYRSALLGVVGATYLAGTLSSRLMGSQLGSTDYLIGLTTVTGMLLGAKWVFAVTWIVELVRARRRIDRNIQGVLLDR